MEMVRVPINFARAAERVRILLIEDNPEDVALLHEILHDPSMPAVDLEVCTRLSDAWCQAGLCSFDVALLDLSLPDSSGLETLSRFRSRFPDVPVVVLTGFADEEASLEAITKGAQDYLIKDPDLSAETLIRSIRYAVQRGRLQDERKKLEKIKDDFISVLSHELRSPVTVIRGAAESLVDGVYGVPPERQKEIVEMIARNANHMNRLIVNILTLSRLESSPAAIQRRRLGLSGPVSEVMRNMEMEAKERRIKIVNEAPPDLPDLYADEDSVVEILTNLIGNALRFSKETIRVSSISEGAAVRISVIDDGPGIPQDKLGKLFHKFTQIERAPRNGHGYKGTGLGLAICKLIVEGHEGRIWAETGPAGAAFHVRLPVFDEYIEYERALEG